MSDAEILNDEADALETLRALVEQIRIGEWRDELGAPLKMSVAYLDAEALLIARGLLKSEVGRRTPRGPAP